MFSPRSLDRPPTSPPPLTKGGFGVPPFDVLAKQKTLSRPGPKPTSRRPRQIMLPKDLRDLRKQVLDPLDHLSGDSTCPFGFMPVASFHLSHLRFPPQPLPLPLGKRRLPLPARVGTRGGTGYASGAFRGAARAHILSPSWRRCRRSGWHSLCEWTSRGRTRTTTPPPSQWYHLSLGEIRPSSPRFPPHSTANFVLDIRRIIFLHKQYGNARVRLYPSRLSANPARQPLDLPSISSAVSFWIFDVSSFCTSNSGNVRVRLDLLQLSANSARRPLDFPRDLFRSFVLDIRRIHFLHKR